MALEPVKVKAAAAINVVEIGGEGSKKVMAGGQTCMPFLYEEGSMPHMPVVALEILDCAPAEWPEELTRPYGAAIGDPASWARACARGFGAKLVCVRLQSVHPDYGARKAAAVIADLRRIAREAAVPLVIVGSGDDERDNDVLPKVSQAMQGERCLFGIATQANYKTLAATCLADGHSIIAESPIDVNIAKQVNILISDMGLDPARIVMHPTTTSMGYGMEYVYSIMERSRLAAFIGDRMLAMPFILFVGQDTWKTKEAKESVQQGINWELATAVSMVQSGGDIIVMRHPDAARSLVKYVGTLAGGGGK